MTQTTYTPESIKNISICALAGIIRKDWQKVYFGAVPYLDAMFSLNDITDPYFDDSGTSVIAYFLGNANTWRGPVAKMIKAELNRRLKATYR